ncbi:hypothetical protein F5Y02DRAFT_200806 [Annulohypoxylon stygium]|nr:hypothetical protein F5Y02DRAFT_200806 [Annulohypoxylon stygium]
MVKLYQLVSKLLHIYFILKVFFGANIMPFEFVDNTTIDRDARRLIRSHVAKGKNVGKTHPSRKKRAIMKIETARSSDRTRKEYCTYDMANPTIEPQIGDSLSLTSLPIESTPGSRTLIRKALSFLSRVACLPGLGNVLEFGGPTPIWIRFLFLDQAYFHCSVAMCLAATDSMVVTPEESVEATYHLSNSLRLVNQKLSGEKALSDTTIASVIAMLQYERLRGQYDQALIHFAGLQQMVELCGGITKLAKNKPALAQKIFRADLEIALYVGTSTQFDAKQVPGADTIDWLRQGLGEPQTHYLLRELHNLERPNDPLHDVFVDISSLAWFLNRNTENGIKLDVDRYQNAVILIGYRLIHINPLSAPSLPNRFDNATYIGLLLFMASFLLSLSHRHPDLPILCKLTATLAHQNLTVTDDGEMEDLLLWVLFLAGISVFRKMDPWLVQRTQQIVRSSHLRSWDEVRRVFSRRSLPWVDSVHGNPGQRLWAQLGHM